MTNVAHFPSGGALLTKQQLAAHLDRSARWIELKVRDGMPSIEPTRRFPHRRFRLAEVEAWLSGGEARPPDRLSLLEQQVASLAATVERIERMVG